MTRTTSTMAWVGGAIAVTILGFALLAKLRPVTRAGYPKLAAYANLYSSGEPFIVNGSLDTALVKHLAEMDYVVIEPARRGPAKLVNDAIRWYGPRVTVLGYFDAGQPFQCGPGWIGGPVPYGCDTTASNFAWSRWVAIGRDHGIVYSRLTGKPYKVYGNLATDFSRPGVGVALAETCSAWAQNKFVDEICSSILWTQSLGDSVDFKRGGFRSEASWDSAYQAGVADFFARSRELGALDYLVGNCGPTGDRNCNGWMLENYPHQRGSSVREYLEGDSLYVKPTLCWLSGWKSSSDPKDQENRRKARYCLCVATLGEGVGAVAGSDRQPSRGFLDLWMDEFAVKPNGQAVHDVQYKGWLGLPLGPAYEVSAGLWRRNFTYGAVLVNEGVTDQQVRVGPSYYRIRGEAPNDGSSASLVTVPGQDGLMLVRR